MSRMIQRKSFSVVVLFAFIFVGTLPVFSQQTSNASEPVVILTALASPQGDTAAGTLASTLTSAIELMLKLTGRVTLKRADFLIPTNSLERTIPYYTEHKAAEAVYGSVTPTSTGAYAIELDVWTASHPNEKPTVMRRTISNVLSSFNLADEMSLRVASAVVGKKLEEGRLVVRNVSRLPRFSVYANGHLLGRNRTSFPILTGSWTIVVAKPGEIGDLPVQTFQVDIRNGKTTTVALSAESSSRAVGGHEAGQPRGGKTARFIRTGTSNKPSPMLKVSPATGSISITTVTAGNLYLDGKKIGHVPVGSATLSSVAVGVQTLTMRYTDGHVTRKNVWVGAGSTTNAAFDHRPVAPGSQWTRHTLPSGRYWESVTYGNGTFVAIAAYSSAAAISRNGVNWTESRLPSHEDWWSVTYGNGTFVAVAEGPSNVVATSSDGVTWVEHTLPSSENWWSVTYGSGTFVAVASNSGVVATSSDGITWTEHTMPRSRNWQSVTFGNGTFVAVASNTGVVATSKDGVTWTEHTMPSSQNWQSVTYGKGTFVAVVWNSNLVATSSNGVDWNLHTLPSRQDWRSVTYGKGTFVAVSFYSNAVAASSDGVTWTEHTMPSSQNWFSVAFGKGTFVATGTNVAATSP